MEYDSGDQGQKVEPVQSVPATAIPMTPNNSTTPERARFDRRMARVCALATLAVVFAGIFYSRETGFIIYALLLAIPYIVFVLARGSRKWQAWGWALAWEIIAFAAVQTFLTTVSIARRGHRSDVVVLVFLIALLLTLIAQLIFVRRAFPGKIAYGKPLFRATLYYLCLLILVGATLPNWYVPPAVRRESEAVNNLRKYSAAMDSYAASVEVRKLSAYALGIGCAGDCAFEHARFKLDVCAGVLHTQWLSLRIPSATCGRKRGVIYDQRTSAGVRRDRQIQFSARRRSKDSPDARGPRRPFDGWRTLTPIVGTDGFGATAVWWSSRGTDGPRQLSRKFRANQKCRRRRSIRDLTKPD